MDAGRFVTKWGQVELTERSACQQHFLDLCELVGHPKPAEVDPKGEFFTFERGVQKRSGGKGWSDVWKKNFFAIEYKGKHKNLDAAYDQLLQYRASLENPPLLAVCDMDRLIVHTNFTGTVEKVHEIPLVELPQPKNLDTINRLFYEPEKLKPTLTREAVTIQVARRLGDIAQQMRGRGLHPHAVARFLDRVVFCLFAEDVGLLPSDLFTRLIESAGNDPKQFFAFVGQLFKAMAKGGNFGLEPIRYFNGNLFDSTAVVQPTIDEIRSIKEAAKMDWDQVDPTIFGTLFERGMDPGKRSQLGAHYTSREDIETVIEPVVMQPLRREWGTVRLAAEKMLEGGPPKRNLKRKSKKPTPDGLVSQFLNRLQSVTVLDPACGSGNFLDVALQKLKDLEQEVLVYAEDKGLGKFFPLVGPWQLYGIERNQYAFELAQVSIWIGYIQWNRANGYRTYTEPVLRRLDTFSNKDAIVDLADPGHLKEPSWPDAEFIVGNPPFLGGKKLKTELGDDYVKALFAVWKNRVRAEADLCCYWFEKARQQIEAGKCRRAGLLATQGIRGGANRDSLKRIKATGDIFFGVSDRDWVLDGANVHVSMVGFDDGSETARFLDGDSVANIHTNLSAGSDVTQARRLSENVGIAFMGDTKGGNFDITKAEAIALIRSPNPTGKPTSDVIAPWSNGKDVTQRSRELWIVDFGIGKSELDASLYSEVFEFLKKRVQSARQTSRSIVRSWWLHERPRVEMRAALAPHRRFIATPRVTKHRFFVWFESPTLPDCQLIVIARSDDFTFGVLHSHVHETWARSQGTQVRERESGFRYTPTSCFETFPFPNPTEVQRDSIAAAAKRLANLRSNWLNPPELMRTETLEFPGSVDGPWASYVYDVDDESGVGTVRYHRKVPLNSDAVKMLADRTLTKLYNSRPTWLDLAHRELDQAVFAAYGWDSGMSDEAILGALLALNFERVPATTAATVDEEELEGES